MNNEANKIKWRSPGSGRDGGEGETERESAALQTASRVYLGFALHITHTHNRSGGGSGGPSAATNEGSQGQTLGLVRGCFVKSGKLFLPSNEGIVCFPAEAAESERPSRGATLFSTRLCCTKQYYRHLLAVNSRSSDRFSPDVTFECLTPGGWCVIIITKNIVKQPCVVQGSRIPIR